MGCARELEFEAVPRLAAVVGMLTVTRHGLCRGRRDSIEAMASRIEIRPLSA